MAVVCVCQAWLRMSFNGCDLGCYLSHIVNDVEQLKYDCDFVDHTQFIHYSCVRI